MSLPDFDSPPVAEVALSVQFDELPAFEAAHFGLLWAEEFRERLPKTATHPPIRQQMETFGLKAVGGVKFELLEGAPKQRCWFLDESETQLVQVQPDRFVHNWRKIGDDDAYPRFEAIRERFSRDMDGLVAFVERHELGTITPNQCEVTYVNHITLPWEGATHHDVGRVFTFVTAPGEPAFLPLSESVDATARFVIAVGEPQRRIGRLHASVRAGFRNTDQALLFIFTLTARGVPTTEGVDGVLGFLDLGREWIVRGFADLTTQEMHGVWGRKQ